jgi:hypothetical protein
MFGLQLNNSIKALDYLLSREDIDERRDLPEYIAEFIEAHEAGAVSDEYPFDALWRAYFTRLVAVAEAGRSEFLREWAGH